MYKISVCFLLLVPLISGGCARNVDGTWKAPFVYRIDVQQGNVVDQEMLDKLKPGMDKNQVKFVMGTPLIKDPFHSNRWDYVYIMEPGKGERKQRRITLYFKNDKLAYVDGDIKIGEHPVTDELTNKERAVTVPLDAHEEGFFSRMFDKNKPQEKQEESETAQDSKGEETETVTKTTTEKPVEEKEELSTEQQKITATPLPTQKDATTEEQTTTDDDKETIADKEQDKNLVRRFWDRITSGAEDSGVAKGEEETERDIRDAEVLEKAGGEL